MVLVLITKLSTLFLVLLSPAIVLQLDSDGQLVNGKKKAVKMPTPKGNWFPAIILNHMGVPNVPPPEMGGRSTRYSTAQSFLALTDIQILNPGSNDFTEQRIDGEGLVWLGEDEFSWARRKCFNP